MKHDTALILGNGPSIDLIKPNLLENFTVFGSNSIYLKFEEWGRAVDKIVMTDPERIESVGCAYQNFPGEMYVGDFRYIIPPVSRLRKIVGRDFVPLRQLVTRSGLQWEIIARMKRRVWLHGRLLDQKSMGFSLDKGIRMTGTVIVAAIQVAVALGFRRILLSGVDANYDDAHGLYFAGLQNQRPLYASDTSGEVIPPRLLMEPPLVLLQLYFEQMGIELVDCTPGGRLRFITKGHLEDYTS